MRLQRSHSGNESGTTLVKKTIAVVKYLREKTLAPHTFSFKFFNSMKTASQILVYSTNNATAEIDVRVDGGTVWLNRHQLAELFERDVKTIGKHIANALNEELSGFPVVAKFATTASDGKTYSVEHFNLDVVLSVGYRVKSQAGVQFRVWATRVLNEHLIRGYSTSQRFDSIHHELGELEARVNRIEIRIQADLPPTQGVFFDGEVYDAYAFVIQLIRTAQASITIIDNYLDDTVLTLLTKRTSGVKVALYTQTLGKSLQLDVQKHNAQYPVITLACLTRSHDRFIVIDEKTVYHFGASLKDLGKKWFAFSKLDLPAELILSRLPIV